jgi:hypothetical protein
MLGVITPTVVAGAAETLRSPAYPKFWRFERYWKMETSFMSMARNHDTVNPTELILVHWSYQMPCHPALLRMLLNMRLSHAVRHLEPKANLLYVYFVLAMCSLLIFVMSFRMQSSLPYGLADVRVKYQVVFLLAGPVVFLILALNMILLFYWPSSVHRWPLSQRWVHLPRDLDVSPRFRSDVGACC